MKYFLAILGIISTLMSSIFIWLYLQKASLPYNESGRYFDELNGIVYDEGAKELYGLIAITLVALTIILWLWAKRRNGN